ncbi:MAG: hypothetical protein QOI01_6353 [Mycobacterium sp.]|jgi:hypothetical protein|nr:hypothetical protein [Mycobacterium sp.]
MRFVEPAGLRHAVTPAKRLEIDHLSTTGNAAGPTRAMTR